MTKYPKPMQIWKNMLDWNNERIISSWKPASGLAAALMELDTWYLENHASIAFRKCGSDIFPFIMGNPSKYTSGLISFIYNLSQN